MQDKNRISQPYGAKGSDKTKNDLTYSINKDGTVNFLKTKSGSTKISSGKKRSGEPISGKVKPKSTHFVVCPHCKELVSKKNLAKHVAKLHDSSNPTSVTMSTQITLELNYSCPICKVGIKKQTKFEKHLRVVHGKNPAEYQQPDKQAKSSNLQDGKNSFNTRKTEQDDWRCPVCKQKMPSLATLGKHLKEKHPDYKSPQSVRGVKNQSNGIPRKNNKTSVRSGYKKSKGNPPGPKHIEEAFRQSFDEEIDGSRDFAHFRREWDGKFGSHPLHDDYDDEASSD